MGAAIATADSQWASLRVVRTGNSSGRGGRKVGPGRTSGRALRVGPVADGSIQWRERSHRIVGDKMHVNGGATVCFTERSAGSSCLGRGRRGVHTVHNLRRSRPDPK
ncbi:hypothetical protein GCM10027610_072980 [Dactylosporangium cerinum]